MLRRAEEKEEVVVGEIEISPVQEQKEDALETDSRREHAQYLIKHWG